MSPPIAPFANDNELIGFAQLRVGDRTSSLVQDVQHCLSLPPLGPRPTGPTYAPFPALLYCFATIDFFSALYAGKAGAGASTTLDVKDYMLNVMHYSDEQVRLLQKIFRHKLVHLAQPGAVLEDNKRRIRWHYWHTGAPGHLDVVPLQPPVEIILTASWKIHVDHELRLDVDRFTQEIVHAAAINQDCYLKRLERDPALREKFATAAKQMFS